MQTKQSSFNLFAAIAFLAGFLLVHLNQLILTSSMGARLSLGTSVLLFDLALVALAVLLILKQKQFFPAAAALLVGVLALFYISFNWYNIFLFLGWAALAFVLAAALMPELASVRSIAKQFYFVPAIILGLFELIRLFTSLSGIGSLFRYLGFFSGLLSLLIYLIPVVCFAAGAFFAAKWAFEDDTAEAPARSMDGATQPVGAAQPVNGAAQPVGAPAAVPTEEEGFISMGKHVLLLLLTCGIWMYIWIYRTTAYTNRVQDEEQRDPTKKLLLCLFVPFYSIYWTYKTAQRVDKLSVQKGLPGDSATMMLILAILIGIVPPIMLQDKINKIATTPDGGMPRMAQPYQPPQPYQGYQQPQPYQGYQQPQTEQNIDPVVKLRNFQRLLDEGLITQEEFDAKKKQILDQ